MNTAHLAERQLQDYDRREPGLLFAEEGFALTEAQAYAIQIEVAGLRQRRGESVAGYKIGCVSETVRRQLGLTHPVFGHVFAAELHPNGCVLDHSRYAGLAIEGELAVRIAADGAISHVFPVIELHNYVFRSTGHVAQELIANNAIHAGVVLPAEEPPAAGLENLREPISVRINGELRGSSDAAISAGLLSLVEHLETFGIHLKRGDLALTGSPLPLYRVGPGDRIEVRCEGLPTVTAVIA